MSKNGNTFVAFLIGLILGAVSGAGMALLFAPEAGEELRQKIQSGAEVQWQKANIELERLKQSASKTKLPEQVDQTLEPQAEGKKHKEGK